MKYKALILDLDGTTVPSGRDGMPSKQVKKAINKAQAQGVKVCFATGRSLRFCKHLMSELNIQDPCVVNNGPEIYDPKNDKYIERVFISSAGQRAAIEIAQRFGIKLRTSSDEFEMPLTAESKLDDETVKLFVGSLTEHMAISFSEELEAVEGISAHITTSWNQGVVDLMITDAKASKKHGIEELLRILNVRKSEAIGVGDYHNDLPLFESVGFKVAMGNAPKELKDAADFVTGSIDEDGVAQAIDKLILSK